MEETLLAILQWNLDKMEELSSKNLGHANAGSAGNICMNGKLEAARLFVRTAVNKINILEENKVFFDLKRKENFFYYDFDDLKRIFQ